MDFLKRKVRRLNVRGTGRGISEYALDLMGEILPNPDIIIRKEGEDVPVIDAKYKQLQTDESGRTKIITSDVRQVWSYCLTPKKRLPFGVIVYPKHELIGRFKERYSMKRGVTIVLRALDLAKATIEGFLQGRSQFAAEIGTSSKKKLHPKSLQATKSKDLLPFAHIVSCRLIAHVLGRSS